MKVTPELMEEVQSSGFLKRYFPIGFPYGPDDYSQAAWKRWLIAIDDKIRDVSEAERNAFLRDVDNAWEDYRIATAGFFLSRYRTTNRGEFRNLAIRSLIAARMPFSVITSATGFTQEEIERAIKSERRRKPGFGRIENGRTSVLQTAENIEYIAKLKREGLPDGERRWKDRHVAAALATKCGVSTVSHQTANVIHRLADAFNLKNAIS